MNGPSHLPTPHSSSCDRVINILSRRTKNNPVILGDPGVGKTALIDGLALRIAAGDVPDVLKVWMGSAGQLIHTYF